MRRLLLVALVGFASISKVGPAAAVTGGSLDGAGHPNVGVMVFQDPSGAFVNGGGVWGQGQVGICSGSLLAPTAFLTRADCTDFATFALANDGRVWVSFDPTFDVASSDLIPVVAAEHHPSFDPTTLFFDYGVATLGAPVSGIIPIQLPPAGLLDRAGKRTEAMIVGYGASEDCSAAGPCTWTYDGARRAASVTVAAIDPNGVEFQTNPMATNRGGGCGGDSGAPYFLGSTNLVVAIHSVHAGPTCHAIGFAWRLDTPAAQAFLDRFVQG